MERPFIIDFKHYATPQFLRFQFALGQGFTSVSDPSTGTHDGNIWDDDEERKPTEKAAVIVWIGDHAIRFYRETKTAYARFEATCYDPRHRTWNKEKLKWNVGRCRLTRHMSPGNMSTAASRCCGLMGAWLKNSIHFSSFEEHQDVLCIKATLQIEREESREEIRGLPNGAVLLSFERKKYDGETEEPSDCP